MTTSLRPLLVLAVAVALCAGLAVGAQTPPAVPAAPVPAPAPNSPPADAPAPKPADAPAPKPAAKPAAKKKEKEAKKAGDLAFSGTVTEVDKVHFTLTLTPARVLQVTPETRFFKGGKPAVFDDVAVGAEVSGQYQRSTAGPWEALAVHLAPKPAAPAGGKKADPKPAEKKPITE